MAQLQGGNELMMFQGSASSICSLNYGIKLGTNEKCPFPAKAESFPGFILT